MPSRSPDLRPNETFMLALSTFTLSTFKTRAADAFDIGRIDVTDGTNMVVDTVVFFDISGTIGF
jgi:hypothetical protein